MDEKNGIDVPAANGTSEEIPKDDDALKDSQAPEATPEEKEMLAMAGESSEEAPSEEPPESKGDQPEEVSGEDHPEVTGAEEDQPSGDFKSRGLLSQDEIDGVLGGVADQMTGEENASIPSEPDIKQADFQQLSATSEEEQPRNIELLMDVELPVSIELGRTKMPISDILGFGPGSIVELDKLVGEPVDLLVNQKCVARGEVVVVEENFGLRITQLVSPEERLKNL